MFSGIIEQKAKILDIKKGVFTVENNFKENLKIGQSLSGLSLYDNYRIGGGKI